MEYRRTQSEYVGRRGLRELVDNSYGPCLSFFLPSHRPASRQRLFDLMLDAERQLAPPTYSRARVDELLQPLRHLVEQNAELQDLTESIALFRAPGFFRCYRVPFRVPELVAVADSFCLRPLHPLFETSSRAYLLLLQPNGARLFWVDRKTISELRVPELGDISLPPRQLNLVRVISALGCLSFGRMEDTGSTRSVSAHHVRAETIACDPVCDYGTPLILAGPHYLCQSYRKLSPSPELLDQEIRGASDGYDLYELQQEAWAIASLYFSRARRKAVDRYYQFWHTLRASNSIRTIVSAARRGTVDVLFLAEDLLQTNPDDAVSGDAVVPSRSSTREEDLLNLAAIDTFLGGGTVYSMPADQVPGRRSAAAVFDY
jgi:Bacterial archaeo-eukaryotic release factor family 3